MGFHLTSTPPVDPHTRNSHRRDPQTCMWSVEAGHRFYNPDLGRWCNRDPIGASGGENVYGFVKNAPIDSADILGLFTLTDAERSLRRKGVKPDVPAVDVPGPGGGVHIPAQYSREQRFEEWFLLEMGNLGWWEVLPRCPAKLCLDGDKPYNPDPSQWRNPDHIERVEELLHPGAYWSMRSRPVNGHANQCTYHRNGDLIRSYPGAGTVDWRPAPSLPHIRHDVDPVILAANLDGNRKTLLAGTITTVGVNLASYYHVRPLHAEW